MSADRKKVNKEIILDVTLHMIDEKEGIKDVNLREIAKRIGCAHTNLYNYYSSLDEIYWAALAKVILNMFDYVGVHLQESNEQKESIESKQQFFLFLSYIIDFSMEHKGWYKLMWMEAIGGEPSYEIKRVLDNPSGAFQEEISKLNDSFTQEDVIAISDILHSYLHGELVKWMNDRSDLNSPQEVKNKIMANLKYLFELLIQRNK